MLQDSGVPLLPFAAFARQSVAFVGGLSCISRHRRSPIGGLNRCLHVAGLPVGEIAQYSGRKDQPDGGEKQRRRPSYEPSVGGLFYLRGPLPLGYVRLRSQGWASPYEERRGRSAVWLASGGV